MTKYMHDTGQQMTPVGTIHVKSYIEWCRHLPGLELWGVCVGGVGGGTPAKISV